MPARMILYFATDLLWASRIKATADALGVACRPVRSVEMLDARLADSDPGALLVDLTTPQVAMSLIQRLRAGDGPSTLRHVRIVAFGPHVEKGLLQQARDAGADEVMPRGALDRNLEEILLSLAAKS